MEDRYQRVLYEIQQRQGRKTPFLVAIDGRCASGKSTLAAQLAHELSDCSVVHLDDFFLRPEQRTEQRLAEPGGNVDRERFFSEVLLPLSQGKSVQYRPFNCHEMKLMEPITISQTPVILVEGSYSCHPALRDYYDFTVFLSVDGPEQLRRIVARNGPQAALRFQEQWIPLEERYFSAFQVKQHCDLSVE